MMHEITAATSVDLDHLFLLHDESYLDAFEVVQQPEDDDAAFERWLSSVSAHEVERVLTRGAHRSASVSRPRRRLA